jgi:hypothetical protein
MATLTAVGLGTTGLASNPQPVTSSDKITAGDVANGAILEVKNGSGSSINVTIVDGGHTPAGGSATSATQAVAAGTTKRFKPSSLYGDSNGDVTVTYSSTTTVTYELYY